MNNSQELSVVTGAFGYSGKYITQRLIERGAAVRTLTGHPANPNPFGDAVEVAPFNFTHPDALTESLRGVGTVFNTYWIRFARGELTFERAVNNLKSLIEAAQRAGVRRFVHVSITGASAESPLPYFRGKGIIENFLRASGLSYAILRPAVIFGPEDILLNNIAWNLRKFPLFTVPGNGEYRLQPVFAGDLADLALGAAERSDNLEIDAVGPETYTFNELIRLLGRTIGRPVRLLHVSPGIALFFASIIGRLMGDVTLTRDEVIGLSDDLLVSHSAPTAPARLSEWLARNALTLGVHYASELARRA
ncbi:MAG TPA: NAD(P)H-binding protein [Candidatus Binataceae bacterium]|nr:NAD(P)H-binding protein [Candidatus Binataceae bacterium]